MGSLVGSSMSHDDLTQFAYSLNAKFDAECRFTEGIAEAVTQHATNIDEIYPNMQMLRTKIDNDVSIMSERITAMFQVEMRDAKNEQDENLVTTNKKLRDQLDVFVEALHKKVNEVDIEEDIVEIEVVHGKIDRNEETIGVDTEVVEEEATKGQIKILKRSEKWVMNHMVQTTMVEAGTNAGIIP